MVCKAALDLIAEIYNKYNFSKTLYCTRINTF
jgi:hypothetical protein